MKRKQYSKEVKLQADSLILTRKHPVRFISNQLGVHEHTLYRWISEYEKYGEHTFPGNGNREFASQREVERLEKNKKLKEELEIVVGPKVRQKSNVGGVFKLAKYDYPFKKQAVEAYQNGTGSYQILANQFDIASISTVREWVKTVEKFGFNVLHRTGKLPTLLFQIQTGCHTLLFNEW